MKKISIVLTISIILSLIFSLGAFPADHNKDYTFEDYMEMAENRNYPGKPGEGLELGFANITTGNPFTDAVQEGLVKEAKLAGFKKKDIYILDNQHDTTVALKNANSMLSRGPDVFIEFQGDSKVNNIIADRFEKAGIPLIAVDIPIPGAPFVGVDNWKVSTMNGKHAVELVEKQWGGIDAVDMILILETPQTGEVAMLRTEGFAREFKKAYGEKAEKKIVRKDIKTATADWAKKAMMDVLAQYPDAEKIAFICLNGPETIGAIGALKTAGRFDPKDIIHISNGGSRSELKLLKKGEIDGSIAYFPEHYGRKLIPAALALANGKKVPPDIYVDLQYITQENLDKYYPNI